MLCCIPPHILSRILADLTDIQEYLADLPKSSDTSTAIATLGEAISELAGYLEWTPATIEEEPA